MKKEIKKYVVFLPVFETIRVIVETDNEDEAEDLAIAKAVEEEPMVCWEVDKGNIEIYEVGEK